MSDVEAIREEEQRLRYLRTLVDLITNIIAQGTVSRSEAERLVQGLRRQVLRLFPGSEDTFEIIYRPRFDRLIQALPPEWNGSLRH